MTSSIGHEPLRGDGQEPGQQRRHLDPREHRRAGPRVGHHDRQVERQAGDERERVRRVDDERASAPGRSAPGTARAGCPVRPEDSSFQRRTSIPSPLSAGRIWSVKQAACRAVSRPARSRVRFSTWPGSWTLTPSTGRPGGHPPHQAGHPDHEELVQVAGEDGQEPDPLQQRDALVLGQLQHPLVEPEPAFLAVEVPVRAAAAQDRWAGLASAVLTATPRWSRASAMAPAALVTAGPLPGWGWPFWPAFLSWAFLVPGLLVSAFLGFAFLDLAGPCRPPGPARCPPGRRGSRSRAASRHAPDRPRPLPGAAPGWCQRRREGAARRRSCSHCHRHAIHREPPPVRDTSCPGMRRISLQLVVACRPVRYRVHGDRHHGRRRASWTAVTPIDY